MSDTAVVLGPRGGSQTSVPPRHDVYIEGAYPVKLRTSSFTSIEPSARETHDLLKAAQSAERCVRFELHCTCTTADSVRSRCCGRRAQGRSETSIPGIPADVRFSHNAVCLYFTLRDDRTTFRQKSLARSNQFGGGSKKTT